MHNLEVSHGCINCENIFITKDNRLKLGGVLQQSVLYYSPEYAKP